jgi:hypothetical protein
MCQRRLARGIRQHANVNASDTGRSLAADIYGSLRYDEEHGWYTVDPVDAWRRVP